MRDPIEADLTDVDEIYWKASIAPDLKPQIGGLNMVTMGLDGIRVTDMTRLAPGPYCTMFLADLGADVIKIAPGGGRVAEQIPPKMAGEEERRRAYNAAERNKRSILLNLRLEEARAVFYRLAKTADVIVEEFRPGVVKRLGVDTIKEINPRIVYCSITGYGQDGPYRRRLDEEMALDRARSGITAESPEYGATRAVNRCITRR